ncbi:MAG: haloacid dehalogenase-like hydrolase, partial [Bacteroidales bacterium]|nr:haloacid dehalogenase-like hydrolase [Bacteroidales bacterium]
HSIAVFNPASPHKRDVARKLLRQGRVGYMTPAIYTRDSRTFRLVCTIIDKIKTDYELQRLSRYV